MPTTKKLCELCKKAAPAKGSVYCAPCRAADYAKTKHVRCRVCRAYLIGPETLGFVCNKCLDKGVTRLANSYAMEMEDHDHA